MAVTTDQPIQHKPLSIDEFLARYGGDNRYELIDGEVFDLWTMNILPTLHDKADISARRPYIACAAG